MVGVVGDVRQTSLATAPEDAVYVAARQWHFADPVLSLVVRTTVLRHPAHGDRLGFRFEIERREDGRLICLSEAWKALHRSSDLSRSKARPPSSRSTQRNGLPRLVVPRMVPPRWVMPRTSLGPSGTTPSNESIPS